MEEQTAAKRSFVEVPLLQVLVGLILRLSNNAASQGSRWCEAQRGDSELSMR
jgi:hypothetical protein